MITYWNLKNFQNWNFLFFILFDSVYTVQTLNDNPVKN